MKAHSSFSPIEVFRYYESRVPNLKKSRHGEWRGPCPVHGGRRSNFAVDADSGRWFCHSQCGRGGDIFALEMVLSHSGFRQAQRDVFAIIGRPDPELGLTPEEKRRFASEAKRDSQDRQFAELWQCRLLEILESQLAEAKQRLFQADEEDESATGELVWALTGLVLHTRSCRGAEVLRNYREQRESNQQGTRRLLIEAAESEADAERFTALLIRILEVATRTTRRRAA